MTNIKDVAKAAGVSPMTVSRVFNHPELVSKKTADQVMEAARALDYVPNLLARSLVMNETHSMGVFVSRPENPLYSESLSAITYQAATHGYNVLMACGSSPDSAMRSIQMLMGRQIDGLILLSVDFRTNGPEDSNQTSLAALNDFYDRFDRLAEQCYDRDFPVIAISQSNRNNAPHCSGFVSHDYCAGAMMAVKYLAGMGHRNLGFLAHTVTDTGVWGERYQGFFRAVEQCDCRVRPGWVRHTTDTVVGGFAAMSELLELPPDAGRPTAVYCANDEIAVGAINACHAHGVRVPQDISIIGHDGSAISRAAWPQLSTVSIHYREMGRQCVELMLEQVAHKPFDRIGKTIRPTLVERGSVADLRG